MARQSAQKMHSPMPSPTEELMHIRTNEVSRRALLRAGVGLAGAVALPDGFVMAADEPPIGTWPAGSQGASVTIGATVPRTGAYAVQGEDELKGWQLAVEHINSGHDLMKQVLPKVSKGVLGKQVNLVVADSAAKPNEAVQEQQTFINENKVIAMTGATSSAVAVALNKFAQREKILYLVGVSGSNDTTGKDCARYSFRQCFYGETAANAIGPVLVKAYGKDKKAAFMTPDYTYGHTVTKSVNDYLTTNGGWTMVTNQVSPLGTSDFSQYLTNIANSGADAIINVNWGRDAVLSVQQAKQFGLTPKMKMVIPFQIPFLAKEVGPELTEGVYAATDFWWTLEDRFPLAKMFVSEFDKKSVWVGFTTLVFNTDRSIYAFMAFWYFIGLMLALHIVRSPVGAILSAIRDNPLRAAAVGHHIHRYKLTAFVVAAGYAGFAGGLLGLMQGFMPPDAFMFDTSGQLVMQTAIGGAGTLFGPLVGAAVWLYLSDFFQTTLHLGATW
jgi:branched-chain amino acid transport system substrate-binding protein